MTSLFNAPAGEQVRGSRRPRIRHVPDYGSSAGQEAVELAAVAGLNLDPWEADTLIDALGERPDGRWAAFEVGINVPRQNGKGSILEARELAGALLFGEKLLIHSAHEQATSSEHFLRLLSLFEVAELSSRLKRPNRGKGSEAILFRNGARILFKTRTGGGGRGLTGDFVGLDEAMILPDATVAALVPTVAARSLYGNPQLWYTGSAVDQENNSYGLVFARLRQRGIAGAPDVMYVEWSIEGDHPGEVSAEVAASPESWAQANPGLGIRIAAEHVAKEHGGALGPREFAVERLGVGDWPDLRGNSQGIDFETWIALKDPASEIVGRVSLSLDVAPDRSTASIAASGERDDGNIHVEVADRRRGTGWVVDRLVERVAEHDPETVIVDGVGPAGSLIRDLEDRGVEVTAVNVQEHAQALGVFIDAVDQGTVRHLGTSELSTAVKGAVKRSVGDVAAWSRKSSTVDISPLVACTLAHWAATAAPSGQPFAEVFG